MRALVINHFQPKQLLKKIEDPLLAPPAAEKLKDRETDPLYDIFFWIDGIPGNPSICQHPG